MSPSGGIALFVGSAAIAGVLLGFAARTEPLVKAATDPDLAAARVTAAFRATRVAVHERAATLAQLQVIRAAIGTDAATVHDLTADERSFIVQAGETIELGQRATTGGATSLLRVPPDAAPLSIAKPGESFGIAGGMLVFTDVEIVSPVEANALPGTVAVARRLAASSVLDGAPLAARLELGTAHADLGPLPANAETVTVSLAFPGEPRLLLPAVRIRAPRALHLTIAALIVLGLGGLGGALLLLATRARRRTDTVAPLPEVAMPVSLPRASTQQSQTLFGVPAPPVAVRAPPLSNEAFAGETQPFLGNIRLGRYEPLSLLGRGGTATVYLARSRGEAGFERRVALKVLRPEYAREQKSRSMFLDEARLASRVDHPNVVQIFDLGRAGDEYYIAMEHVDGDDLESLLFYLRHEHRCMPIELALGIARRICDGLTAAHTAADSAGNPIHLVHRDMKPGNVLVSRNGEVKVADFGIAKAAISRHHTTQGSTKGTVQFMAPEQRMGKHVDARADVFGAAAIAYELVTGIELDMDLKKLLERGTDGWPHLRPISEARPDAPPELEAILWRALSYAPEDRYATAQDLELAFATVMDAHGWFASDREIGAWVAEELRRRNAA